MPPVMTQNNSSVPLGKLKPGESGTVIGYAGDAEVHQRLCELGIIEGTRVEVKRLAPFGDPMELVVRGYHLSLRRKDAAAILIAPDSIA